MKHTLYDSGYICCEEKCPQDRECSNHETAGDFRTEDGMTPDIKRDQDGKLTCSKVDTEQHNGPVLFKDGFIQRVVICQTCKGHGRINENI